MNETGNKKVNDQLKQTSLKVLQRKFQPPLKRVKQSTSSHLFKRHYRLLTQVQKEAVIIARYGAVRKDLEPLNTFKEVSRALRIPYSTVERTVKQFLRTGTLQIKKRGRPGSVLTEAMKARLLQPALLKSWSPFSLRDRMLLCQQQFNFPVSYYQLRRLYKHNGVSYKKTEWQYRVAQKNEAMLDEKRRQFAQVLARVIN